MTSAAQHFGMRPLQTQALTSLSVSSEPESKMVHLSPIPVRLESRGSTCTQHWLFSPHRHLRQSVQFPSSVPVFLALARGWFHRMSGVSWR